MAVKSEKYEGNLIINEIVSKNISKTIYDTKTKIMTTTFNNGLIYEYYDVPHLVYTRFRAAESQGNYFGKEISKKYKYKKIGE
jgi:hypothetical protein